MIKYDKRNAVNGVIDDWCVVFCFFGPKGPKTVPTLGDLEIFEKKNWEFLSHSKQEKARKFFEIFFGSFLTLTLSKNRKKSKKHTFWTPNPIWVIWFGWKWSKTVPIMVEYHRPPFSHVEIWPRRVRRCPIWPKMSYWTIDRIWIVWFDCKWCQSINQVGPI